MRLRQILRDLEPRIHAVRRSGGWFAHPAREEEHRYGDGTGTHNRRAAGGEDRLRYPAVLPHDGGDSGIDAPATHRRRHPEQEHCRRSYPRDPLSHRRWRPASKREAGLRAASHPEKGDPFGREARHAARVPRGSGRSSNRFPRGSLPGDRCCATAGAAGDLTRGGDVPQDAARGGGTVRADPPAPRR